jgi:hypothetical protein
LVLRCKDSTRQARRSLKPCVCSSEAAARRLAARLTTFFQYVLQHSTVQGEFADEPLQRRILTLKRAQLFAAETSIPLNWRRQRYSVYSAILC